MSVGRRTRTTATDYHSQARRWLVVIRTADDRNPTSPNIVQTLVERTDQTTKHRAVVIGDFTEDPFTLYQRGARGIRSV
jgi:hypothetical protein